MDRRIYRALYRIRRAEEEIARLYPTDRIMSPVHLSIGQEAIAVGVCDALDLADVVFGSYRCHAMYLAKGGDLNRMFAELYGRADGCARGKGGSMHLVDVAAGVMPASAVVGTTIPQAVGYALACRMRREPRVVVCFFGDGAAEEGVLHESLNFASLKRLPVLFVCENNGLAIHSRQRVRQAGSDVTALARAHGISAERVDGMDVLDIRRHASEAVSEMRGGDAGPSFLEITCYRWMEHVGPGTDFHCGYRDKDEGRAWLEKDQVKVADARLTDGERKKIEADVEAEIQAAITFAEASPFPEPAELYTDLFKE